MKTNTMHMGRCKICGGVFWESFKGARGEDLCDHHWDEEHEEREPEDYDGLEEQ